MPARGEAGHGRRQGQPGLGRQRMLEPGSVEPLGRPEAGLQARGRAKAPGAAAAALGVERRRLTGGAMAPGEQRSPARQSQPSIYRGYGCFSPTSRGEEVRFWQSPNFFWY